MRYIDRSRFNPKTSWVEKAEAKLTELEALSSDQERSNYFKKSSAQIWGDLKKKLLKLSKDKCWYSEARCDFSYYHVDHFRPKGRIKDGAIEREGYWWLAYNWKNYRVAGGAGNSPKGSSFKLVPGSPVATKTGPFAPADEVAMLLDPCRPGDPSLLSFQADGRAVPTGGLNQDQKARVDYTIETLNLNFSRLRRGRKEVWDRCQTLADQYEALAPPPGSASPTTQAEGDRIQDEFRRMIRKKAPYSSTARHFLQKCGIEPLVQILQS